MLMFVSQRLKFHELHIFNVTRELPRPIARVDRCILTHASTCLDQPFVEVVKISVCVYPQCELASRHRGTTDSAGYALR